MAQPSDTTPTVVAEEREGPGWHDLCARWAGAVCGLAARVGV
jgi:hypothetical protein